MNASTNSEQPKKSGTFNLLIEYGPILCFFILYKYYAPSGEDMVAEVAAVVRGTIAFVIAAILAAIASWWKLRTVSPMLILSTVLVVFFGTLTIFLRDPFWIQVKPTAIYLFFGISLLIGYWRGKALLKTLLQTAFEGLDDKGWMILSRNWGIFFLGLAALNETLRHMLSMGAWISAKLWIFMPLSFIFTLVHMPMLMRHGLAKEEETEVLTQPPHE